MTENAQTETNPHAASVLKLASAMLRYALWPSVATAAAAVLVSTLLTGTDGLFSSLIGVGVALVSSLATLALMRKTAAMNPMMVMAVAMGGLVGKLLVLLGIAAALGSLSWLHREALALSMLAVVLVWAGAEAMAFRKTKIPTIIPDNR
ncbi:hypothetical protein [Amycolatopsis cihanbeyliensis]|uniref:ATP synthase protein I n=1 Tax=Amycolatopsis cihanbeyliensis TaxID=1128664 RepID=A0A542DRE2_AMYCI|nr:hypothetical protein [Amycolatopsis cihanbeyliensis]TQJ05661.1 hypothetical protein FB471_5498 [Amycolatopsis cihanbeyliensis]